jgi:hypothetical protein
VGCGPKDSSPSSTGSGPTSTAAGGTTAEPNTSGLDIQGETAIGPFGDPCALLTADEVSAATGFTVTGITRGKVTGNDTDPAQNCVYLTDGPALAGAMAGALGAMAGQDPTAVTNAVNAAGGLVGVTLSGVDPADSTPDPEDSGDNSTEPGVGVKMITDLGPSAAVITLPSGAAALAAKGTTVLMLMVLIDGQISADGTEQMLRSAYGNLN